MNTSDLFKQDDFAVQYQLARQTGDRRFGSACPHDRVKNGTCERCLRRVVVKRKEASK